MPDRERTEWLVETGIGEDRAILIQGGQAVAARLSVHGTTAAGLVADARLIARAKGSRRGTALLPNGDEALVDGLAVDASEGAALRILVTRAAIAETGRHKRAQAKPTTQACRPAPTLARELAASGLPVRTVARFPDDPWPEIVETAMDGAVAFAGGSLMVTPTPAMTLIDVDGTLPGLQLALAAVPTIASAIPRLGLSGSIGIDFPTLERREDRRAIDEALAKALHDWPHQSTAMNGFGFVQLVSRLERASIVALVRAAPALAGARVLLRRAEHVAEPGALLLRAHSRVLAAIRREWHEQLARRTGRVIRCEPDDGLALLSGFAQAVTA